MREAPGSPIENTTNNPKMANFLVELNELLDRYQYNLTPINNPTISVSDRLPPPKPTVKPKKVKRKTKK